VRHNHIARALEWLKLNHSDYADIDISEKNLLDYPEDMPPISVKYKLLTNNKTPEGTSISMWMRRMVQMKEIAHSLYMD
jgi:hypothetical protein